ncbi:D-arabinose 5-phosphate isomerase KdsD [Vibrio chagasii]|nr:D-arabinose 5-phosphate isomerase KdsD [Vibrio chagasii]CAH6806302.1 D-arabinose 5-phosphate isomerase KdsD [Vibrio chagasii]CAH6904313.1 D-arabinose 5-phosphate isomerase KdsD [Vibrio chagasii]CAH6940846.1 D-arabinose 5-phosphate isomerase KdsD [Vibrio chagasii]CAH6957305.1 D-arabinose 5-phosphate isomerase KdsD [Vibrio chagasii]
MKKIPNLVNIAKEVIKTEIDGLAYMSSQLDIDFCDAVQAILGSNGRTIICGMGKSGIIGKKIAASFASTGTPSFFMHPGEAFHGDLGMVKKEDVFLAISNSGETDEVLKLLPFLKDNGNYIIAMTGNAQSTLAQNSDCHLSIAVPKEACPHQLAPTSSTTATLVMGDALTVSLMAKQDFQPEQFARFHPGGSLGRKLLSKVKNEMVLSDKIPFVDPRACFIEVVSEITRGELGLVLVDNAAGLPFLITDGDVRRAMEVQVEKVFKLEALDMASTSPKTISEEVNLEVAFNTMSKHNVSSLLVVRGDKVIGILKK